jgi:hypothetical protein
VIGPGRDRVGARVNAAIPNAVLRHSDDGPGQIVSQGGALNGELGLVI